MKAFNLPFMSKRHKKQPTDPKPLSPIITVTRELRDVVIAAKRSEGYLLWSEEDLGKLVRLRFLPSD